MNVDWEWPCVRIWRHLYCFRTIMEMWINLAPQVYVDRDSSVGIATRYGLEGPGIESRWGRDFPRQSRPALGAHSASYIMGTGSFPGAKRPGCGVDHPPPSSAKVKERVELYLYSGRWWPFLGQTLPYPQGYAVERIVNTLRTGDADLRF